VLLRLIILAAIKSSLGQEILIDLYRKYIGVPPQTYSRTTRYRKDYNR
jgi:accessory gene regulator protein AgrB